MRTSRTSGQVKLIEMAQLIEPQRLVAKQTHLELRVGAAAAAAARGGGGRLLLLQLARHAARGRRGVAEAQLRVAARQLRRRRHGRQARLRLLSLSGSTIRWVQTPKRQARAGRRASGTIQQEMDDGARLDGVAAEYIAPAGGGQCVVVCGATHRTHARSGGSCVRALLGPAGCPVGCIARFHVDAHTPHGMTA